MSKIKQMQKWSDARFRIITIPPVILIIILAIIMISLYRPLEDKHRTLMDNTHFIMEDSSGVQYRKSALMLKSETALDFSRHIANKIFEFNYSTLYENKAYLRNYLSENLFNAVFPTEDLSTKQLAIQRYSGEPNETVGVTLWFARTTANNLKGGWRLKIRNQAVEPIEGGKVGYKVEMLVDYVGKSAGSIQTQKMIVSMDVKHTSTQFNNQAGVFVDRIEVIQDKEQIKEIIKQQDLRAKS